MAKLVISCSLLALSVLGLAGPYSDLAKALEGAKNRGQILRAISESRISPEFKAVLEDESQPAQLRAIVADLAATESRTPSKNAVEGAKAIKSSPLYVDQGVKSSSNWLSRALEELGNRLSRLLRREDTSSTTNLNMPLLGIGSFITYLFWAIIGIAVVVLTYLAFKQFSWKKTLKRRAAALLSDEEPLHSLDEWLEMANRLEAEGKYREAVRCLYLACLLRFDEHRVARFERSQTNWEHLARIEASPALPENFDFRTATQEFDQIWYGFRIKGAEDLAKFRATYKLVTEKLSEKVAA